MSKFEVFDFIEGTREMVYMAMDEHGILCSDGHWLTEEELYALSDDEVISMYESIYGRKMLGDVQDLYQSCMIVPSFPKEKCCVNPCEMIEYSYKVISAKVAPIHERSEVNDEMARDEARHGVALKGMLERYFK